MDEEQKQAMRFSIDRVLNLDLEDEEELHRLAAEFYRKSSPVLPNKPINLVEMAEERGTSPDLLKLYASIAGASGVPLDDILSKARRAYLRVATEVERIHNARFQPC